MKLKHPNTQPSVHPSYNVSESGLLNEFGTGHNSFVFREIQVHFIILVSYHLEMTY